MLVGMFHGIVFAYVEIKKRFKVDFYQMEKLQTVDVEKKKKKILLLVEGLED